MQKEKEWDNETYLDQELKVDIIGLGCCSFGLLALTSSLKIDPLCVQNNSNEDWSEMPQRKKHRNRGETRKKEEEREP